MDKVKADHKSVLIVIVAIIDCILGGVILYSNNIETTVKHKNNVSAGSLLSVSRLSENKKGDLLALAEVDKEISKKENQIKKNFYVDEILEKAELEVLKLKEEKQKAEKKAEEERKKAEEATKIVYDGLTLEQLAAKLNRFLKNELKGQGMLIASYSLEQGVDPYIAASIMMHETGCKWNCSSLMKRCNNDGGKKGSGCGSYQYYDSLETGIKSLIKYLSKNYFKKGLDTPKEINKKYAEDKSWYKKVNKYVKEAKAA